MKTSLVTGATGLVGYSIVQSLLKRGQKVRVLVRSVEKAGEQFNETMIASEPKGTLCERSKQDGFRIVLKAIEKTFDYLFG